MYRSLTSGLVLIILSGYFLFAMKREVEHLNFSSASLSKQINNERFAMNLLKAEFSHLTSPQRLELLADSHLKLSNINSRRMVSDPLRAEANRIILAKNPSYKPRGVTKWRYKDTRYRNIHRASYKVHAR